MREIRIPIILFLAILFAGMPCVNANAEDRIHDYMMEVYEHVDNLRIPLAIETLNKVLAEEEYNYHALVLMGQLLIEERKRNSDEVDQILEGGKVEELLVLMDDQEDTQGNKNWQAEKYLLLATVAQPHRPEAYLVLAQMYYDMGYVSEGDRYAELAQSVEPESYESYCLLGQRFMDSGNYTGAFTQYWTALKRFGRDPYIIDRLFISGARGGLQPYYELAPGIMVENYPDYWIFEELKEMSSDFPDSRAKYRLPLFKFSYCEKRENPEAPFDDLYEAFIKASVDDPAEYDSVRNELDKIRREALQEIKPINDERARAKALYLWLKKRVLRKYDIEDGIRAEQVVENNKYLCLTGAILYTLIGREAGLPISGIITPGHAYAVLNEPNRQIQVELTAEPMFGMPRIEGFDVEWWEQFKQLNRVDVYGGLRRDKTATSSRNIGEVSPEQLTAYQFTNVIADKERKITEKYKDELDLVKNLRSELRWLGERYQKSLSTIEERMAGEPNELRNKERELKDDFDAKRVKIAKQITQIKDQIDKERANVTYGKGRELIRASRALAPTVEEFVAWESGIYINKAIMESKPALNAVKERSETIRRAYKEYVRKYRQIVLDNVKELQREMRVKKAALQKKKTEKKSAAERLKAQGTEKGFSKLWDVADDILDEIAYGPDVNKYARKINEQLKKETDKFKDTRENIYEQAKEEWPEEKKYWLSAVDVFNKGIDELPCNKRLARAFQATLWTVAEEAERNEDVDTLSKLVNTAMDKIPDSDFVRQYRQRKISGL